MKTKALQVCRACWHWFTDVPGWPDAPKKVRIRRILPAVIPAVALLALWVWKAGFRDPHIRAERAAHQSLFALQDELISLHLGGTDQQAADLAAHAAAAEHQLLATPEELGGVLHTLKKKAADRGWDATFQATEPSAETPSGDTVLAFLPARARLASTAANSARFSSLLALLEDFSSADKRIDLTRLGIRADEQGRYTVELNLRLAYRPAHEKTPQ